MSIIDKLSTSLGINNETPNQQLAVEIATIKDTKAIAELFECLTQKNKALASDAIKVIYETALLNPTLISPYIPELLHSLRSKNNRIQWGAMIALDYVTLENTDLIYGNIQTIISVADSGSVITNDHCVEILVKLCTTDKYVEQLFPLLVERLHKSPTNQLPKYAENSLKLLNKENRDTFISTLVQRLSDFEEGTKKSRLEKVIAKAKKL